MKTIGIRKIKRGGARPLLDRLREVVVALDRRAPRPGRAGEPRIAEESAALKQEALRRIAQLQPESESGGSQVGAAVEKLAAENVFAQP